MDKKRNIFLINGKNFIKNWNRKKSILKYSQQKIILIIILIALSSYLIKREINIKIKERQIIDEQNRKKYEKLRKEMLRILSRITHKKNFSLDNVYIADYNRLGNALIALNRVIFYCEILKCKRIFVNKCYLKFIKNTIYDEKYNLTIEYLSQDKRKNLTSLFRWPYPYYLTLKRRPENRFEVIKEEILKNLPHPTINKKDLYIHIRNGDVYKHPKRGKNYAQPPLCFYKKVIESKKFNNVHIIAENDKYPIIKRLVSDYKNVNYNKNSLRQDASKLVYAYNIVGSISSFVTSLIKLNDNLKYYWEYDIYHTPTRFNHLHYSISNFTRKYTIYKMAPSTIYKETMYRWRRTKEQLDLMINDTCPNDFEIIKPNI